MNLTNELQNHLDVVCVWKTVVVLSMVGMSNEIF